MSNRLPSVEVLVCIKCKRQTDVPDCDERPGKLLLDRLLTEAPQEGITVKSVECLSNCSQGCSIALRGDGRWTYVYGNLHETDHVETVRDGARLYQQTVDGLVPWRERPEHFRKNCIARIPPSEV